MRKYHSKIFLCLGILCFALLLTNQIEGPPSCEAEGTAAGRLNTIPTIENAAFGAVLLCKETASAALRLHVRQDDTQAVASVMVAPLPGAFPCRDANGRVVWAKRYVNSVYQVFHQEAAAG